MENYSTDVLGSHETDLSRTEEDPSQFDRIQKSVLGSQIHVLSSPLRSADIVSRLEYTEASLIGREHGYSYQDDDTGAVKFSGLIPPYSPGNEDVSDVDEGALPIYKDDEEGRGDGFDIQAESEYDPRTPAHPIAPLKNLGSLMGATQLFNASSPQIRTRLEPSSDRPSPDLFNQNQAQYDISSPLLRNHQQSQSQPMLTKSLELHSSPLLHERSSIAKRPIGVSTYEQYHSEFSTRTVHKARTAPFIRRVAPEPQEHYISRKESQEIRLKRQTTGSADDSSQSSDEDSLDIKAATRHRTNADKARALESLAAVNISATPGPVPSGDVEVPGTGTERRRSCSEDCAAGGDKFDSGDTQQEMVADSQDPQEVSRSDKNRVEFSQPLTAKPLAFIGDSFTLQNQSNELENLPETEHTTDGSQLPGLDSHGDSDATSSDREGSPSSSAQQFKKIVDGSSANTRTLHTPSASKPDIMDDDESRVPETSPPDIRTRPFQDLDDDGSVNPSAGDSDITAPGFTQDDDYNTLINMSPVKKPRIGKTRPIRKIKPGTRSDFLDRPKTQESPLASGSNISREASREYVMNTIIPRPEGINVPRNSSATGELAVVASRSPSISGASVSKTVPETNEIPLRRSKSVSSEPVSKRQRPNRKYGTNSQASKKQAKQPVAIEDTREADISVTNDHIPTTDTGGGSETGVKPTNQSPARIATNSQLPDDVLVTGNERRQELDAGSTDRGEEAIAGPATAADIQESGDILIVERDSHTVPKVKSSRRKNLRNSNANSRTSKVVDNQLMEVKSQEKTVINAVMTGNESLQNSVMEKNLAGSNSAKSLNNQEETTDVTMNLLEVQTNPAPKAKRTSSRSVAKPFTYDEDADSTDELAGPGSVKAVVKHVSADKGMGSSRSLRNFVKNTVSTAGASTPVVRSSRRASVKSGDITNNSESDVIKIRAARLSSRKSGIFSDMAFSVSYVENELEKEAVCKLIEQHGGRLLDGFQELFEKSSPRLASPRAGPADDAVVGTTELALTPDAYKMGFTCLLADQHSRRAKFIQALALGLPCISGRWVQHCVKKNKILEWDSYLLAAGESNFLGGAIRNRNLCPYDANISKFADVYGSRKRLLDGKSIMLIMGRGKAEQRKQAYLFLTRVLGARRIFQAASNEAARKALLEAEAVNDEFDWVYVNDREEEVAEKAIFGPAPTSRKRKRATAATGDQEVSRAPKKVHLIGDEYVVQSLILGKLLED